MGISRLTTNGSQKLIDAINNNTQLKPKYFKFSNQDVYDPNMTDLPNAWLTKDIDAYLLPNNNSISFVCTANKFEAAQATSIVGIFLEDDTLLLVGEPSSPIPANINQRIDVALEVLNVLNYIDTQYFDINLTEKINLRNLVFQKEKFLMEYYDSFYIDDLLNKSPFFTKDSTVLKSEKFEKLQINNAIKIDNCDIKCLLHEINEDFRTVDLDPVTYEITKFIDNSPLSIYNSDKWEGHTYQEAIEHVQNQVINGRLVDNILTYKHTNISHVHGSDSYEFLTPSELSDKYSEVSKNMLSVNDYKNLGYIYQYLKPYRPSTTKYTVAPREQLTFTLDFLSNMISAFDKVTEIKWYVNGTYIDSGLKFTHTFINAKNSLLKISATLVFHEDLEVSTLPIQIFVKDPDINDDILDIRVDDHFYSNSTYFIEFSSTSDLNSYNLTTDNSNIRIVRYGNNKFKVIVNQLQDTIETATLSLKDDNDNILYKFDVSLIQQDKTIIKTTESVNSVSFSNNKLNILFSNKQFASIDVTDHQITHNSTLISVPSVLKLMDSMLVNKNQNNVKIATYENNYKFSKYKTFDMQNVEILDCVNSNVFYTNNRYMYKLDLNKPSQLNTIRYDTSEGFNHIGCNIGKNVYQYITSGNKLYITDSNSVIVKSYQIPDTTHVVKALSKEANANGYQCFVSYNLNSKTDFSVSLFDSITGTISKTYSFSLNRFFDIAGVRSAKVTMVGNYILGILNFNRAIDSNDYSFIFGIDTTTDSTNIVRIRSLDSKISAQSIFASSDFQGIVGFESENSNIFIPIKLTDFLTYTNNQYPELKLVLDKIDYTMELSNDVTLTELENPLYTVFSFDYTVDSYFNEHPANITFQIQKV